MTLVTGVGIGDILAVRTSDIYGELIRFGSALLGLPSLSNHIAGMVKVDNHNTPWVIEAEGRGVSWRIATDYLEQPYTLSNRGQPKTPAQRALVSDFLRSMLGTPYDDMAIVQDACRDLGIHWDDLWAPGNPTHVVCSSLLVVAYAKAGLHYPTTVDPRHVQPADWVKFILDNGYQDATAPGPGSLSAPPPPDPATPEAQPEAHGWPVPDAPQA